jgi:hypothetical protein
MNAIAFRLIGGLILWLGVIGLVGCASPEQRIKKNPDLFATFSPEVQDAVSRGEVLVGFTPEMVTMALGKPNRIYSRQTAEGVTEVWSYTATQSSIERQRVNAQFRSRDSNGRLRTNNDWVWVDVSRETEYERIRLDFVNGVVLAIETLQR